MYLSWEILKKSQVKFKASRISSPTSLQKFKYGTSKDKLLPLSVSPYLPSSRMNVSTHTHASTFVDLSRCWFWHPEKSRLSEEKDISEQFTKNTNRAGRLKCNWKSTLLPWHSIYRENCPHHIENFHMCTLRASVEGSFMDENQTRLPFVRLLVFLWRLLQWRHHSLHNCSKCDSLRLTKKINIGHDAPLKITQIACKHIHLIL